MGCKYAFGTLTLVRWWMVMVMVVVMVMVMVMVWDTRGDIRGSERRKGGMGKGKGRGGRGGMDVMSNNK